LFNNSWVTPSALTQTSKNNELIQDQRGMYSGVVDVGINSLMFEHDSDGVYANADVIKSSSQALVTDGSGHCKTDCVEPESRGRPLWGDKCAEKPGGVMMETASDANATESFKLSRSVVQQKTKQKAMNDRKTRSNGK
jgi:hypothetical protein